MSTIVNGYFVRVTDDNLTTSGRINTYATYADMLTETDERVVFGAVVDATGDPSLGSAAIGTVFYEKRNGVWVQMYQTSVDAGEIEFITNTTDTEVTLNVLGGKYYTFAQPLTSITLSSVEDSVLATSIVFTASSDGVTVSYPESLGVVGSVSFNAGKSYIIKILKNKLSVDVYTPGVTA